MRYVSFIHRENASFGVSFPDFPGCVAVGDTREEALRQGRKALAFHIEGLCKDGASIPSPRPIDAINSNPELANWRDGADMVLIPPVGSFTRIEGASRSIADHVRD